MEENEVEQTDLVELQIKSATKVLESLLHDSHIANSLVRSLESSFVDLLHVNCEVNHLSIHIYRLSYP